MRFRLLFLLITGLLTACGKEAPPVRLDFVGATNLTSSDRTVTAADTIRTHVFAESGTADAPLKHLSITVTYEPNPEPIIYPALLSSYLPANTPSGQQLALLDLDLSRRPTKYIFRPTFGARSTSGTERWEYTVTDTEGHSATRAYRLTVRKADSAAVYHNYSVQPRFVPGRLARVYLALRPGLLLPRFAVDSLIGNQSIIDLVAESTSGSISLKAPATATLPAGWVATRRTTKLRITALDGNGFNAVVTAADLANAYAGATGAETQATGALAAGNVFAFKTDDGYFGLLYVSALAQTPVPTFTCTVRMQK